jgi:anti-sigma regulatory factor (Ser/Thr protein kinase)
MEKTLAVSDPSCVAEVRRAVALIGHSVGLTAEFVAQVCLITTELCTNILKYAIRGVVTVSTHESDGVVRGVDIVAIDKGPGIANVEAAFRDGFSTGGSLGLGLGTVRRAAAVFDLHTGPGQGAAIFVRMADKKLAGAADSAFLLGARMVAMRGEHVCGDGWSFVRYGACLAVTVVDGLGHGPKAAVAARTALGSFHDCIRTVGPAQALGFAHQALLSTRGAVMAVAVIDPDVGSLRYCGIGNIAASICTPEAQVRLASSDGTIGFGIRTPRESSYPWGRRSTLVMNSDGLSTKWNLAARPGLLNRHPVLIAALLHDDFSRTTDDATVVVVQNC